MIWGRPSVTLRAMMPVKMRALALVAAAIGCSAVYPEVATPARPAPNGATLDPPPPADLVFLRMEGGEIPARTRDGRAWDEVGGAKPDPFAIVFIGKRELFRTPTQSNSLTPTWPNQKKANYRVPVGAILRVEVWDANSINNHPICVSKVRAAPEEGPLLRVDCDSDAKFTLRYEPAHAKLGLGLFYELRTTEVFVTRTIKESPATRAGLQRGDQILKVEDREVKELEEAELRSLINSHSRSGVTFVVRGTDGKEEKVSLKDGPIYPELGEEQVVD